MELCDIDVKMEDEDLALILLIYLPPSYENFVSSFSIGKDSITLEEVKYSLYSRELQLKVFGNGDKASAFGLLVTDFAKGSRFDEEMSKIGRFEGLGMEGRRKEEESRRKQQQSGWKWKTETLQKLTPEGS